MATKRRKLLIGLTCLSLLLVSVFCFWPTKDPIYKGHHLSEWVGALVSHEDVEKNFAPPKTDIREAVLATGNNNIQLLVHWIENYNENTPLNRMFKVMPLWFNQLSIFDRAVRSDQEMRDTSEGAAKAFQFLGDKGTNAIPQLEEIVRSGNESAKKRAVEALVHIGKPSLPLILSLATNDDKSHPRVRHYAIAGLSRYTNEISVRTFLIKAKKDPDESIRLRARDALDGRNPYF